MSLPVRKFHILIPSIPLSFLVHYLHYLLSSKYVCLYLVGIGTLPLSRRCIWPKNDYQLYLYLFCADDIKRIVLCTLRTGGGAGSIPDNLVSLGTWIVIEKL